MKRAYQVFEFVCFILIPFAACFLVATLAFIHILNNPENDSTGLVKYGYAILGGIASVCFAWSRSLNPEDKETIDSIVLGGMRSFYAALLYLIGAMIKYGMLHSQEFFGLAKSHWAIRILRWAYFVPSQLALVFALLAVLNILLILWRKLRIDG